MPPADTGQNAPDFTLKANTGEKITLSDYRGESPTVLLFFPLAFSPVCTSELITVRDDYATYEHLGARVLALSIDSQFTLKAWAEQLELPFPLLSDFNKDVARAYGTLDEDFFGMKGVSKRAAFVVDEDGTIVYRWVSDDPGKLPEFDGIKRVLGRSTT